MKNSFRILRSSVAAVTLCSLLSFPASTSAYSRLVNDRAHEDDIELQLNIKANVHNAATSGTSESTDPDPEGRSLLRRYARAGYCPESLKRSEIPHFYETCLKLAGNKAANTFTKALVTQLETGLVEVWDL